MVVSNDLSDGGSRGGGRGGLGGAFEQLKCEPCRYVGKEHCRQKGV